MWSRMPVQSVALAFDSRYLKQALKYGHNLFSSYLYFSVCYIGYSVSHEE